MVGAMRVSETVAMAIERIARHDEEGYRHPTSEGGRNEE